MWYRGENRTEHQGRQGRGYDGSRHGGGDGNEEEDEDRHEDRDEGRDRSGNGDEIGDDGRGERESGNLGRDIRVGAEDARGEAMPTSIQQLHPQDPTPQRDRRTMRRTQIPGMTGKGQDRGGRRRGEEAQEIPEEL